MTNISNTSLLAQVINADCRAISNPSPGELIEKAFQDYNGDNAQYKGFIGTISFIFHAISNAFLALFNASQWDTAVAEYQLGSGCSKSIAHKRIETLFYDLYLRPDHLHALPSSKEESFKGLFSPSHSDKLLISKKNIQDYPNLLMKSKKEVLFFEEQNFEGFDPALVARARKDAKQQITNFLTNKSPKQQYLSNNHSNSDPSLDNLSELQDIPGKLDWAISVHRILKDVKLKGDFVAKESQLQFYTEALGYEKIEKPLLLAKINALIEEDVAQVNDYLDCPAQDIRPSILIKEAKAFSRLEKRAENPSLSTGSNHELLKEFEEHSVKMKSYHPNWKTES